MICRGPVLAFAVERADAVDVIMLDNKRVLSCDIPIIKADQRTIMTIDI